MAEHLHVNAHPPPPEKTEEKAPAPATHAGATAPTSVDGKEDKPDRFGEELADDAHVWRVYDKVAKEEDKERVQRWNGGLNNLALFAGLFSGITTTFIIESQNDLKPDFSELAYRVQNATAHGRAYVEEPFIVPLRARVVNCLWLASLLLSLSAALIAIMGQDWIEMFVNRPVCNARQWAQIRTFRMKGIERWYMPAVIATAPVLLHSSLFLFGAGLIVFMDADAATQNLCIALCVTTAWLYAVTMFSPVLWSSSPFRSPATVLMRRWFCAMFRPGGDAQNPPARQISKPNLPARMNNGSSATPIASPALSAALTLAGVDTQALTSPPGGAVSIPGTSAPRLPGMQSVPPAPSAPRREAVVAPESYDAEKAEPQPISRRSTLRSRAAAWSRRLYSKALATLNRFGELYGPDFTNAWIDIPKDPSAPVLAHSLSWLYTASSSPDVLRAVVTALGDQRLGREVGKAKATQRVFKKIRSDVKANAWRLSLLELSRFVLVSKNLGRTDWPGRILRCFTQAIEVDKPAFSEDSLLALAYVTDGFRHQKPRGGNDAAPDPASETPVPRVGPPKLLPLCSSIPICSPITLSSIASVLPQRDVAIRERLVPVCDLIVIMNRWRDALPESQSLIAINDILQSIRILDEEAVSREHPLGAFCSYARPTNGPSPLDRLVHTLCSVIPQLTRYNVTLRSAVDLLIHLARMTSDVKPGGKVHTLHPCLAHVLGSDHPAIINAAWADRHARDILSATRCMGVVGFPHPPTSNLAGDDKRPLYTSLVRTLVRHMSPPSALIDDHLVFQGHRRPRGDLLYELVKAMGAEAPADLFRRVLEQSALVDVARFNRQFWYVLAAVATWIGARAASSDGPELFALFVSSRSPEENSPAWNLADAVADKMSHLDEERHCFDNNGQKRNGNSATNPPHPPWHAANGVHGTANKPTPGGASEKPKEDCLTVALHFLGALERVRTAFPDSALWTDIARSVGLKSDRCPKLMWLQWREAVHRATGIDPLTVCSGLDVEFR